MPATDRSSPQHRFGSVFLASAQTACQSAVGAVFTAAEAPVLEAIDAYAASHDLPGRSAVVREALARLLDMPVAIPPKPTGS